LDHERVEITEKTSLIKMIQEAYDKIDHKF